jgi:hypothetical protein
MPCGRRISTRDVANRTNKCRCSTGLFATLDRMTFEQNRKYSNCILCGHEGELTREHILGKAFATALGVKDHWEVPLGPILSGARKKGSSPITDLAPRLLCAECNGARHLGKEMEAVLPALVPLCRGGSIGLSESSKGLLQRYFERVAAIVDVHTSSEQVTERGKQSKDHQFNAEYREAPPVIDQDEREKWLAGASIGKVSVRVGHHPGDLGNNPDFNIAHFRTRAENQATRETEVLGHAKRVTMVLGCLAVCVDIESPMCKVPSELAPAACFVQINQLTEWPPASEVSDDAYFALRHQDENTRLVRLWGPTMRALAKLEQEQSVVPQRE